MPIQVKPNANTSQSSLMSLQVQVLMPLQLKPNAITSQA
jgi:hypothetical protein